MMASTELKWPGRERGTQKGTCDAVLIRLYSEPA